MNIKVLQTPVKLLKRLPPEGMQYIYPNAEITLGISLYTPATICTYWWTEFFMLANSENFYRSKMTQDKLNEMNVLNIDSDIAISLMTYEDAIEEFADKKARKVKGPC